MKGHFISDLWTLTVASIVTFGIFLYLGLYIILSALPYIIAAVAGGIVLHCIGII